MENKKLIIENKKLIEINNLLKTKKSYPLKLKFSSISPSNNNTKKLDINKLIYANNNGVLTNTEPNIIIPRINIFGVNIGFYFLGYNKFKKELNSQKVMASILYSFIYGVKIYSQIRIYKERNMVFYYIIDRFGKEIIQKKHQFKKSVSIMPVESYKKYMSDEKLVIDNKWEKKEVSYFENNMLYEIIAPIYVNDEGIREKKYYKKFLNILADKYSGKTETDKNPEILKTDEIINYFNVASKNEIKLPSEDKFKEELEKNNIYLFKSEIRSLIQFGNNFLKNIL